MTREQIEQKLEEARQAGIWASPLQIDDEDRLNVEPFGYYTFAWLPKRCRNGKIRWLTWVERHDDGTYTLGNRAH